MSGCGCQMAATTAAQRRTLVVVLALNALMFVIELIGGWLAQSTGLIADSLDMLADAVVYSLSLLALNRDCAAKRRAALTSGYAQLALALLVIADSLRRLVVGSEPVTLLMFSLSTLALMVNCYCLYRIAAHQQQGAHMQASYIFSKNDVLANLGVMIAALLVWLTGSALPDLLIALVIATLVARGGWQIVQSNRQRGGSEA